MPPKKAAAVVAKAAKKPVKATAKAGSKKKEEIVRAKPMPKAARKKPAFKRIETLPKNRFLPYGIKNTEISNLCFNRSSPAPKSLEFRTLEVLPIPSDWSTAQAGKRAATLVENLVRVNSN